MKKESNVPSWCETVYVECPNCGATVKATRYDDEEIAKGYCHECDTVVEVEV